MKSPKQGPVTAMKAELEKTLSETKALKAEYLRSLADFDNFRRRKEKEFTDFRELANERLLLELVPVLDNIERAIQASDDGRRTTDDGPRTTDEGLRKGVRLTAQQLREALGKFGFAEYSCVGEPFDPRKCEAVSYVVTDEKPEGTIVTETAKGYLYRTRVLRPAMVIVAKAGAKPETDDPETVTEKQAPESGDDSEALGDPE
jgi:molecular chaperone GrpE